MTSILCPTLREVFARVEDRDAFFSELEKNQFLLPTEAREQPVVGIPGESCKTNLFFGFFFDGTKNNYLDAETGKNHSNVARLYDCYPGLSTPGVLPAAMDWKHKPERYTHFFKTYIPGVSSRFDLVGDEGTGTLGAASGAGCEDRIVWALVQVINNIHRYFLKSPLVNADETLRLVKRITLSKGTRQELQRKTRKRKSDDSRIQNTRNEFESLLRKLHKSISAHMPVKPSGKVLKTDPAIVKTIHVSIFGFSRGATQARAFSNWMRSLCSVDSELCGSRFEHTLAGFPVEFDFLGLFDTVASVGVGNTMGNTPLLNLFDGHSAWADAEDSLRIPAGIRCVHLVAAHELRRSFPVDSISVKQVLPANCEEVIVPGVHSDLGSGYAPCEQGKGTDPNGADMLARIPLVYMYKAARLSGVPLKLEFASPIAKQRFQIDPKTIQVLNDYLDTCKEKSGITSIMREQARKQIEWRVARRASGKAPLHATECFKRASNFDKNDLHSANLEFDLEIAEFEAWVANKPKGFLPKQQPPGFDNSHEDEWEEIATWWNSARKPEPAVMALFDDYVHDSRAWFKLIPGNPDNEKELHEMLQKWVERRQRVKQINEIKAKQFAENQRYTRALLGRRNSGGEQAPALMKDGLSPAETVIANEYEKMDKDKKTIPRMITEGREPYGLRNRAGYLRFRKVYGGWDSVLLSSTDGNEGKETSSVEEGASRGV